MRKCVAICPTYGRYPQFGHLLEEAVESFLRQDYPAKAMVIINDAPTQLLMPHNLFAGVYVLNLDFRVPTLGSKYNRGIWWAVDALGLKDDAILLPWEDDDISLSHRMSQAAERLSGNSEYFNPQRSWYLPAGELRHDHYHGVCHNASAFTLKAWKAVGGYPDRTGNQDALMDGYLKRYVWAASPLSSNPAEWSYIYRWGVSPCHVSGNVDHAAFYEQWGKQPVQAGEFTIRPHWRQNYAALCATYLAGGI